MRSVAEVCAKSRIRAPGREQAHGLLDDSAGPEAATITRSAPRPPVSRLTSEATSTLRGSQVNSAPQRAASAQPLGNGIGGGDARAGAPHQHREHQADRALAQHHHELIRLRIALAPRLSGRCSAARPSVARSKETAVGNLLHAALHDPVHHPHVLRETAARRLKPGRDADFLIDRALRVKPCAGSRNSSCTECGGTPPRGRPAEIASTPAPTARHHSGRFMAVNARRRQQVVFDLLQIGVADAAGFHPDQDLARPDGGRGDLLDATTLCAAIYGGMHGLRVWRSVQNRQSAKKSPSDTRSPGGTTGAAGATPAAGPADGANATSKNYLLYRSVRPSAGPH